MQFPGHTHGNGVEMLIQQVNLGVENRTSQGEIFEFCEDGISLYSISQNSHGGLGWTIVVHDDAPGIERPEPLYPVEPGSFTADNEKLARQHSRRARAILQGGEVRGNNLKTVNSVLAEVIAPSVWVGTPLLRD